MQAMVRQVEDQSHEESEFWSTSKPLAKLGKGLPKLSVVRWRKTSISQGKILNLAGCAKISQDVPKFRRVYQNHYVHIDLRDFSQEL